MKVTVTHLMGNNREIADYARTTIGLDGGDKEVSDEYMRKLYLCEHSPIRNQVYKIRFEGIPYSTGMHFARHKIGVEHFFSTQRGDRTGIDRSKRKQTDPVLYEMVVNSQAIVNISRKRLCNCADKETIRTWKMALEELKKINHKLVKTCVPECVYRGWCYEHKSCNYHLTEKFMKDLNNYRENINNWNK